MIGLFKLSMHLAHFLRLEGDPNPEINKVEVESGYAIGTAYQRCGYATEAGKALVRYAFEHLRLRRLTSGADEKVNAASHYLARKLGFQMVRNLHPDWPGWLACCTTRSASNRRCSASTVPSRLCPLHLIGDAADEARLRRRPRRGQEAHAVNCPSAQAMTAPARPMAAVM